MGAERPHPLDNPAHWALSGPQSHLAMARGRVRRFPLEVSPWSAVPGEPEAADWADLARLTGGGNTALLLTLTRPPAGWEILFDAPGVQMTAEDLAGQADPEAREMGAEDVPEILELVERTRPGPFLKRTVELGTYLGIRREGRLVALAGERLRPGGWSEISAVCTDPDFRGEGLAARLMRAVAHRMRERGEAPFLHAAADNTSAIRLYESLGFRLRRPVHFLAVRVPEHGA
ncbi:GNAT family N-acetyltransferase [Streptomyces sp. NA04227]|uniref:GNAT family N-acetyltransferase n=1 Tax=Streptomyces sp. NA04227 TaxID=2742136 RepID=UPI0020CA6D84|nr:GNAT family N-acetyltransferase [Streptomyces sp. NA04227]